MDNTSNTELKGFFGSLFDLHFTSFMTLKFLRIIYAILLVLILLGAATALIAGLASGDGLTIIAAIIFVPLIALLWLVLVRVQMELIAVLFRIGENTSLIARLTSAAGGPPQGGAWPDPQDPRYGGPGAGH